MREAGDAQEILGFCILGFGFYPVSNGESERTELMGWKL